MYIAPSKYLPVKFCFTMFSIVDWPQFCQCLGGQDKERLIAKTDLTHSWQIGYLHFRLKMWGTYFSLGLFSLSPRGPRTLSLKCKIIWIFSIKTKSINFKIQEKDYLGVMGGGADLNLESPISLLSSVYYSSYFCSCSHSYFSPTATPTSCPMLLLLICHPSPALSSVYHSNTNTARIFTQQIQCSTLVDEVWHFARLPHNCRSLDC